MAELENIVAKDEWRVLQRTLPKDIKDEMVRFEELVGKQIGRSVSLGAAVDIYTIIVHFLREHEPELEALAKSWKEGA